MTKPEDTQPESEEPTPNYLIYKAARWIGMFVALSSGVLVWMVVMGRTRKTGRELHPLGDDRKRSRKQGLVGAGTQIEGRKEKAEREQENRAPR
jgi:hypothetical protein